MTMMMIVEMDQCSWLSSDQTKGGWKSTNHEGGEESERNWTQRPDFMT